VTIALGLWLAPGPAAAADKNDRKCIDAAAKAIQKFAATSLKELSKCREKPKSPFSGQCDESLPKIQKAVTKRDKAIEKGCKSLDPARAFGYAGCQAPGCESTDSTAAGYQACVECDTGGAAGRVHRVVGNGCGNGFLDAGEECDDGNTTPGDLCSATCRSEAICGNGMLEPREECDASAGGSTCAQEGYQCVPVGLEKECTCVPPCALDPVPARVAFRTDLPSGGACGCTLSDSNDTSCSGASKVADLQCGKLLVGGGLSAVPPGPTPDGATTYMQLKVCGGDELIIGPDDGEGPDARKNCSKGADAGGNPRCFFGPAIGVVNNTAPLSACVINGLQADLRGTMNATTGHATTTVELQSKTFLTGDLIFGRCRGGPTPGKPCSRGGTTPRGDCAVCNGGDNNGKPCQDDTTGRCAGGTNAFKDCTNNGDCPLGICSGNCPGGSCIGLCADDVNAQCVGGANAGMACTVAVCESGGNLGLPCTADGTCSPDSCGLTTTSICNGGANQGAFCDDDGDCPGSTCTTSDCPGSGVCSPGGSTPVQACPVCVDDKFNPITDGSTGKCDLGANPGGACSSTNSEGLTIDCAPRVDQFLDNLPVTLNNMTTGQATMVADADGTFCNFGSCEGGGRAGEPCNNSAECEGGTCHKTCQGGLDANEQPLDGTPCENHNQCRGLTNGYCGQNAPGAFIIGDAGGATVRRIIENGQPAPAPVTVGDVKQSKVGAVFCIPVTSKQEINSAASLPGPGAVAIEGTFTVFGKCAGGASAGDYCLDDSECPGGTCG
jgi:cysteine-rich repeat protein